MSRIRHISTLAAAAVALTALAGCVPASTLPSGTVPDEVPVPDCVVGSWLLDLEDYSAQALAFMVAQGIPASSLTYAGTYRIEITARDTELLFSAGAEITATAVVEGHTISGSESWFGSSGFEWGDEAHDSITLSGWEYNGDMTISGDIPEIGVLDPYAAGEISMACSGDTMSLNGPGAPLVGLFVRQ